MSEFEQEMTKALKECIESKKKIESTLFILQQARLHYVETPTTGEKAVADMYREVVKAINILKK